MLIQDQISEKLENPKLSEWSVPVNKTLQDLGWIDSLSKEDVNGRVRYGVSKYGMELHTHDGRDSNTEIFEELMDALIYSVKAWMETGMFRYKVMAIMFSLIVRMVR